MAFLLYFGVTSFWVAESKDLGAPIVLAAVPMRQTKRRTVAEAMQNQSSTTMDIHGGRPLNDRVVRIFPALECCTRDYPVNRPRDV